MIRRELADPVVLRAGNGCDTGHLSHAEVDGSEAYKAPEHRVQYDGAASIDQPRCNAEYAQFPRRCGHSDEGHGGKQAEVAYKLLLVAHATHVQGIIGRRHESCVIIVFAALAAAIPADSFHLRRDRYVAFAPEVAVGVVARGRPRHHLDGLALPDSGGRRRGVHGGGCVGQRGRTPG